MSKDRLKAAQRSREKDLAHIKAAEGRSGRDRASWRKGFLFGAAGGPEDLQVRGRV